MHVKNKQLLAVFIGILRRKSALFRAVLKAQTRGAVAFFET
jgi:hypothetical protein